MTLRFHTKGRAPDTAVPQTQWQAERMRGPIMPMEQPKRTWWPFRRAR